MLRSFCKRRLIMSLVWNLVTGAALGAPAKTLVLRGVEIVDASTKDGLVLTAEIECGERLTGILLREDGDKLGVALTVERPEVRCSAGAETRELTIPFIDPKGRDLVALPAGHADAKMVLQDATLKSTGSAGLAIEWDNVCRSLIGVVLVPQSDGTIGVAAALAAGASGRKARGAACEGGRQSTVIHSVHGTHIAWSVIDRPGKVEDLYAVRVVAPSAVKISADGELSMSWQRRCREIALGVLFGEDSPATVAVVTAYLPNVTCHGAKMLSETIKLDAMTLMNGTKLLPMSRDRAMAMNRMSYGFRLVAPEKIEFAGLQKNVTVRSSAACSKRIGMVVGKDSIGNTAMAHLAIASEGVCTAKSVATKSVLPLRVATSLNPRVFPLRVMGSLAH